MGIVEFLEERLAEDQRVAEWDQKQRDAGGEVRYSSGADFSPALGRLMFDVRFNPARVLAEVAAKREILAEHAHGPAAQQDHSQKHDFGCHNCHADTHCGETMGLGWCQTVRLMATPHASHPDYDPGWRVE